MKMLPDIRVRPSLLGGLLAAGALALYVLTPAAEAEGSSVEILPPEARPSAPAAAPEPEPLVSVPAPADLPPAPPPATAASVTNGLRLHGLAGTGAILATPDGHQRLVFTGREVLPGVTVKEVRQHHVVLASAAGEVVVGFAGTGPGTPSTSGAASSKGRSLYSSRPAGAALATKRAESVRQMLAFEPRRANGRTMGFTIRPDAQLPVLQRAGLLPGDTILAVNGQSFNSIEKVMELESEVAGSLTAEFEIERNGRRLKRILRVNQR